MNQPDELIQCPECKGECILEKSPDILRRCMRCDGKGKIATTQNAAMVTQPPLPILGRRITCGCGWVKPPNKEVESCPSCGNPYPESPLLKPAVTVNPPDPDPTPKTKFGCHCTGCRIGDEVHRAKAKHPDWPTDPLHAFAVIAEEFGEAAKEALQLVYEPSPGGWDRLRTEVTQLGATCHRFLESMPRYAFEPSTQHRQ